MKKLLIWLVCCLFATSALPVLAREPTPVTPTAEAEGESSVGTPVDTADDGRPLYSAADPPDFPVFNSIIDGTLGDERYFLTVAAVGGNLTHDALALQPDQTYEVRIAYCNDGVARGIRSYVFASDAKVQVVLPAVVDGTTEIISTITASNTVPTAIVDRITLQSSEPLNIEYINGSARIESGDETDDNLISSSQLFGKGALIGTHNLTGIVLDGPENAGSVVFRFQTSAITDMGLTTIQDIEDGNTQASSIANTANATQSGSRWSPAQKVIAIAIVACVIAVVVVVVYTVCEEKGTKKS